MLAAHSDVNKLTLAELPEAKIYLSWTKMRPAESDDGEKGIFSLRTFGAVVETHFDFIAGLNKVDPSQQSITVISRHALECRNPQTSWFYGSTCPGEIMSRFA